MTQKSKSKISHKDNTKGGFIILYTVLITTVILTVIIGVVGISYKELLLSSSARESHVSFFAADTGIECGLFLDRQQNAFTTPSPTGDCAGSPIEVEDATSPIYTFRVSTGINSCAKVRVNKDLPPVDDGDFIPSYTQITSWGYNSSCESLLAGISNVRLVERKIEATYPNIYLTPTEEVPAPEGDAIPEGEVIPVT